MRFSNLQASNRPKMIFETSSNEIGNTATIGEARTVRKLQFSLLPFLFALYVVAFIDRINLGFAALTMNRELAITSQQFGLAAGIFFLGYFLVEVPSNLILHKIGRVFGWPVSCSAGERLPR
jgi:fucose permease